MKEADGWRSTNQVREEANVHFYRTEKLLEELVDDGKVVKDKKPTVTFWKFDGD